MQFTPTDALIAKASLIFDDQAASHTAAVSQPFVCFCSSCLYVYHRRRYTMNVSRLAEIIWYRLPRFDVFHLVFSGTNYMPGESS